MSLSNYKLQSLKDKIEAETRELEAQRDKNPQPEDDKKERSPKRKTKEK